MSELKNIFEISSRAEVIHAKYFIFVAMLFFSFDDLDRDPA